MKKLIAFLLLGASTITTPSHKYSSALKEKLKNAILQDDEAEARFMLCDDDSLVNAPLTANNDYPLHLAVAHGSYKVMDLLLKNKNINVSLVNNDNEFADDLYKKVPEHKQGQTLQEKATLLLLAKMAAFNQAKQMIITEEIVKKENKEKKKEAKRKAQEEKAQAALKAHNLHVTLPKNSSNSFVAHYNALPSNKSVSYANFFATKIAKDITLPLAQATSTVPVSARGARLYPLNAHSYGRKQPSFFVKK